MGSILSKDQSNSQLGHIDIQLEWNTYYTGE